MGDAARPGCARSVVTTSCVARRRPSAVATIASACGAVALACSCSCACRAEHVRAARSSPLAQPPAGAKATTRARATARGELQRDEAAERVADEVGGLEARVVHRALDRVGDQRVRSTLAVERRPARVAGQRRREHVVAALERGQHELPRPPRVHEAVQAHERRAGAAAVRRTEGAVHGLRGAELFQAALQQPPLGVVVDQRQGPAEAPRAPPRRARGGAAARRASSAGSGSPRARGRRRSRRPASGPSASATATARLSSTTGESVSRASSP